MNPEEEIKRLKFENSCLVLALIVAVLLLIIFLSVPKALAAVKNDPHVTIKVEEVTNQGGVTAAPYTAPHFDLETVGDSAPTRGDVLKCEVQNGTKAFFDHNEKYLLFVCAGTGPDILFKMKLTGLAFDKVE